MKKISILFVLLLFTVTQVHAYSLDVYFPKSISIVDREVTAELVIHNLSNKTEKITLASNTSPFQTTFSQEQFDLLPNETKKITVSFSPLTERLDSVYSASIEVKSINYYIKEIFTITQKSNRTCMIDLDYSVKYNTNADNYRLELFFKNNDKIEKEIEIIGLKDISLDEEIGKVTVPSKQKTSTVRFFDTQEKMVVLEYRCNGMFGKKEISLPEKKEPVDVNSKISGMFIFVTSFDSLFFQIVLVIILIILVLSFSTRYIKYVYKR